MAIGIKINEYDVLSFFCFALSSSTESLVKSFSLIISKVNKKTARINFKRLNKYALNYFTVSLP